MPRTKRAKLVSLTRVQRSSTRTRQRKSTQLDSLLDAAKNHHYAWLLCVACSRNAHLKEVRRLWEGSRIVVGANKVSRLALGGEGTGRDEVMPGIAALGERLSGPVALLFTDSPPDEVTDWFGSYERVDFARAGTVVDRDVVLEPGPVQTLTDPPAELPHSLEPQLRALGMPTELRRGTPTLLRRFEVCARGKPVTKEAAQILKHLSVPLAKFRLIPVCYWTSPNAPTDGVGVGGGGGGAAGSLTEVALSESERAAVVREGAELAVDAGKREKWLKRRALQRRTNSTTTAAAAADKGDGKGAGGGGGSDEDEDEDEGESGDEEMGAGDDEDEEEKDEDDEDEEGDEEEDEEDKVGKGMMLPAHLR